MELVREHPEEILKTPALPLLSLENPALYGRLIFQARRYKNENAIKRCLARMSEKDQRRFACDCAERVLPIFTERRPRDTRVEKALSVVRRFVRGEAKTGDLLAAHQMAMRAAAECSRDRSADGRSAYAAAMAASESASTMRSFAFSASQWAANACGGGRSALDEGWEVWHREMEWQVERALFYIDDR